MADPTAPAPQSSAQSGAPSGPRASFAYSFAAVPLVAAVTEWIVNDHKGSMILPAQMTYLVLACIDRELTLDQRRQAPDRNFSAAWILIAAPLYLWRRATRLGQRRTAFWAWIASFCLAMTLKITLGI